MIDTVVRYIVPAALSLLPPTMDSPAARAMLIAIGLQESKFLHRSQIGGPARSFWQFERGGGIVGVMIHPRTRAPLSVALRELRYADAAARSEALYSIIEHNDIAACVCARLLLWTLPGALPDRFSPSLAWETYLDGWRPGKPHRETWNNYFEEAWVRIDRHRQAGDVIQERTSS